MVLTGFAACAERHSWLAPLHELGGDQVWLWLQVFFVSLASDHNASYGGLVSILTL